jgi:hypothetical protein
MFFSSIPFITRCLPMIAFIFLVFIIFLIFFFFPPPSLVRCFSCILPVYLDCALALFNEFHLLIKKRSSNFSLSKK